MMQGELELDRWYITRLEARVEELFLIIKGKNVVIESMAQKDCLGCKYLSSTKEKDKKEFCYKCSIFWDSNYTKRDSRC